MISTRVPNRVALPQNCFGVLADGCPQLSHIEGGAEVAELLA